MDIEQLRTTLADAGCGEDEADRIIRMYESGSRREALRQMKKNRCRLMEQLHESGRKVDCMDFLIRSTEKEMKQADN